MKKISDSDLLIGLTYYDKRVYQAYFDFMFQNWLTSKFYGPQTAPEIQALYDKLPQNLQERVQLEAIHRFPMVVAQAKSPDWAKVELVLSGALKDNLLFLQEVAFATLLNADCFFGGGINYGHKTAALALAKKYLQNISDLKHWANLFARFGASGSVLELFEIFLLSGAADKQDVFFVIKILTDAALKNSQYAAKIFEICLYIMAHFDGNMREAVKWMDVFCQKYSPFADKLQHFLLKHLDRYFSNLDFPYQGGKIASLRSLMEHLSQDDLALPRTWKMKLIQNLLKQHDTKENVRFVLSGLNGIYNYKIEAVDEEYYLFVRKALKKYPQLISDQYENIKNFETVSIFRRVPMSWEKLSCYSVFWQKTLILVYQKAADNFVPEVLAETYFALIYMLHCYGEHSVAQGVRILPKILKKDWQINSLQSLIPILKALGKVDLNASLCRFLAKGTEKLVPLLNVEQTQELCHLDEFWQKNQDILQSSWNKLKKVAEAVPADQNAAQTLSHEQEVAMLLAKIK